MINDRNWIDIIKYGSQAILIKLIHENNMFNYNNNIRNNNIKYKPHKNDWIQLCYLSTIGKAMDHSKQIW